MNPELNYSAIHYAERADDYVKSEIHSNGPDLNEILKIVSNKSFKKVLDLGCGGGHVSYKVSPFVDSVIACDITEEMLESVENEAKKRGLKNIKIVKSVAEKLPFNDNQFDAVFCRFTTHHWNDVCASLREIKRVLVPNGLAMFIDVYSPEIPLLDTWLQTLEVLRDISHVRNFRISEWSSLLGDARFFITELKTFEIKLDFEEWLLRSRTPTERREAIISLLKNAPSDVLNSLDIEENYNFKIHGACFITHI